MARTKNTPSFENETVAPAPEQYKIPKTSLLRKIMLLLIAVFLIMAAVFSFRADSDPNKAAQEEIEAVVEKVGKLISLPENELPTVATVTDTKDLAQHPFFKRAKVGDQVLLYTIAQKAFLYDPAANIILEVASLGLGNR